VSTREERFAAVVSALPAAPGVVEVGLPTDPAWVAVPEAVSLVEVWHAELTDRVGDRLAAASYLAGWIAEVPARLVGVPVVLGAPVPEVEADDLHARRHPDGWFDGLAVHPWTLTDPVDPLDALADGLHELTGPLVAELAARLPVGVVAIWGAVADSLAVHTLHAARAMGRDADRAWDDTSRVLDGVERRLGARLVRPRPLLVPCDGGTARWCTRGTCCRYHRTCLAPDVRGEGYCSTCPLRDESSAVERIAAYLETTA
jgi:hypothetical protein